MGDRPPARRCYISFAGDSDGRAYALGTNLCGDLGSGTSEEGTWPSPLPGQCGIEAFAVGYDEYGDYRDFECDEQDHTPATYGDGTGPFWMRRS